MAAANPPSNAPTEDELDDLLNGIEDGQDLFDTSNIRPRQEAEIGQKPATTDAGLGIDEEIKIVKKRQPVPKLDENRLLSSAGVPKLRKITKDRLKFKGKGHEYGDVARMLNMYQLWLDDLYPRAKFADGLAMIEKLGHTKRIQFMRKEWIDEGKPKTTMELDREENGPSQSDDPNAPETERMEDVRSGDSADLNGQALVREAESAAHIGAAGPTEVLDGGGPDEDELDALLAESTGAGHATASVALPIQKTTVVEDDDFADDMEALAEMEGW
ncbi:replication fork protection component Swi3-domain-containing protein [Clohesyomyces aquaticus]|uniref:Chromosome segregation in meiosis protein n=1 Tax=Clohesyomyces aquaticus TaxID=1231657 RepID=A0A1Y1YY70_9PLEO|nr:replication fork protection component Swi3-domain-containing protein [Clohesyomyces aquaticus]